MFSQLGVQQRSNWTNFIVPSLHQTNFTLNRWSLWFKQRRPTALGSGCLAVRGALQINGPLHPTRKFSTGAGRGTARQAPGGVWTDETTKSLGVEVTNWIKLADALFQNQFCFLEMEIFHAKWHLNATEFWWCTTFWYILPMFDFEAPVGWEKCGITRLKFRGELNMCNKQTRTP